MRLTTILLIIPAALALAITAGIVVASLGDTQSASGTITVSSTSADLYICEPGNTPGPACGPDDSDGDEIVFEGAEDMRPGESRTWDIRLKNVGTVPFQIVNVFFTSDNGLGPQPTFGCPNEALQPWRPEPDAYSSYYGVTVLGKSGDEENDNYQGQDFYLQREVDYWNSIPVYIASGDYEDLRLRLHLDLRDSIGCQSVEWDVGWEFVVN